MEISKKQKPTDKPRSRNLREDEIEFDEDEDKPSSKVIEFQVPKG